MGYIVAFLLGAAVGLIGPKAWPLVARYLPGQRTN